LGGGIVGKISKYIAIAFLALMMVPSIALAKDKGGNTEGTLKITGDDYRSVKVEKSIDLHEDDGFKIEGILSELRGEDGAFKRNFNPGEITVTDNTGNKDGYTLQVKAEKLEHKDTKHILKEGTLKFNTKKLDFNGDFDKEGLEEYKSEFTIDGENTQSLVTAKKDYGYGISTYDFGEKALKLNIEQPDVESGIYITTITYSLTAEPQA